MEPEPLQQPGTQQSQPSDKKKLVVIGVIVAFLVVSVVSAAGLYFFVFNKVEPEKVDMEKETQIEESVAIIEDETANWRTYRNEEYGFEVKYPEDFKVEIKGNMVEIFSPKSMCEFDNGLGELSMNERSAQLYQFKLHNGVNYDDIWEKVFGFRITGEYKGKIINNYDGVEFIGGKEAKYFAQGAEMPFGRFAYLVGKSDTEALEINFWVPAFGMTCNPPLKEYSADILSTFKFIEKITVNPGKDISNPKFTEYFNTILEANPELKFTKGELRPIIYGKDTGFPAPPPNKEDLNWVFSPDGKKAASILAYRRDHPDSRLDIYNRNNDGKVENLELCGTPCSYWTILWLNNEQFVFIDSVLFDLPNQTYYKLYITLYDLAKDSQVDYSSQELKNSPNFKFIE